MLRQGSLAPFQTLRPNKAHPLFKGLISAWTPGQLWSRIPRPANGGTPVTGPFGLGASFNGTSDSVALGSRALVHTSANSRFALVKVGTASGTKNISAGGNGGLGFRINGTTLEVVHSGVAILFSATSAVSTGEFCSVGYTYLTGASSPGEIYKNGTRIQATTASATTTDNGTDFLGQNGASAQYWDGHIYLHLAWNRVLTAAEMRMLDDDPWQIFEPVRVPVKAPASGAYTLTADSAAWQFAAQNATLRVARKLTAANAPWEFAAQSAGLTVARKIAAGNAPWEFAVQDATLTYAPHTGAYTLTAESAAWQFAVPDATLNYSPMGGQSGGWLPSLPTREERDEYVRRQREALGIIPKRIQPVAKVIKRIAKQAAKRGIEPTVEQVREVAPFKQVDTQHIADALAINFRIYLALLERDRQEREKTRQFIAEQIEQAKANAIVLETSLRLQEEEEVFVVMSILLAD